MTTLPTGLTQAEVLQRRAAGQGNNVDLTPSRTYGQIVRANVVTFVNITLFSIGAMLAILGSPADAITTVGLITLNILVGLFQEIRAKRKLDKIALLARPKATVIREGQPQVVDPSELVLGDVIRLEAGDQAMTDGLVIGAGRADMDESLLTGEADTIPKETGDKILSGSFCIAGSTLYETTQVGAGSFANQMTARARQFKQIRTPLQKDVNLIVRVVSLISAILGGLLYWQLMRSEATALAQFQMAAVVMGTIPQGLIFLVTLSYALGALRIAGKGALIQQMNAVESLSNVTTLCLDKTGTLTTNQIKLHDLYPTTVNRKELTQQLTIFANSATSHNKTSEAILNGLEGDQTARAGAKKIVPRDEVAFTSALKWSGLVFDDGANILGAPEMLEANLASFPEALQDQIQTWADLGLRVLLFTFVPKITTLHDENKQPVLPANMIPLGLVCLSDELRAEAQATLADFAQAGVKLKIISGDNPHTVAALARQAGFDTTGGVVSGLALAEMDESDFARVAAQASIFGRIKPDQKELLVKALQSRGEYVAMIGDGVNDVLSLKQAQVGIAMQSGSTAARNVADIILMNDSFAVLPSAFTEGQRIVNAILDTMRLLLSRTFQVILLMLFTAILHLDFPFLPTHDTLNSYLVAGLPPLLLAIWSAKGQPPAERLREVLRFVIPSSLSIALLGMGIYVYILDRSGSVREAQTALTLNVILCGAALILFLKPPSRFWVVYDPQVTDWKPPFTAVVLLLVLLLVFILEPVRKFFALFLLPMEDYALIGVGVGLWILVYRWLRLSQVAERFFHLL